MYIQIVSNGWVRLDPVKATREVIAPLVGGLLGMILFPGLSLQLLRFAIPSLRHRYSFIREFSLSLSYHACLHPDSLLAVSIYPAIFVVAGFIRSTIVVYDVLSTWSQTVRDTEFLVELRLRNHEPESEKAKDVKEDNGDAHSPVDENPVVGVQFEGEPEVPQGGEWIHGDAGE